MDLTNERLVELQNLIDSGGIVIPRKILDVHEGIARWRCAYGGRGSGKTRSFATMLLIRAIEYDEAGIIGTFICGREFQNSLHQSSYGELVNIIHRCRLQEFFRITNNEIRTVSGRITIRFLGFRTNVNSVKSTADVLICWADEAENISENSWNAIEPSIRGKSTEERGWLAEIWVTWNPESEDSATHRRYRAAAPDPLRKIAEVNYTDNDTFMLNPAMVKQMEYDKVNNVDNFEHIWLGKFKTHMIGAYFTKQLMQAREERRFLKLFRDPLLPIACFWDIGGAGRSSDSTAIWVAQAVDHEIRVLDYYEASGQSLDAHVSWLRQNGYGDALQVLPHDGLTSDRVYSVTFKGALENAGFYTKVIKNQGTGAAIYRIEAVRRIFNRISFDEEKTVFGVKALANYREKKGATGGGLGPIHDAFSHAADAFGLLALHYSEERTPRPNVRRSDRRIRSWATA